MIERGIDMYFCLQCASNNYQARHKGHTAQSGTDARAQTTTTGSATANPSRSPRGVPAPTSDASVLLAAEARLKRAAAPVAKAPVKAALSTSGSASSSNSPSQSPPVGASAIPTTAAAGTAPSLTSAPIGISSPPSSPLSPLYSSNSPSPSPSAPSVFAVAPPPPRAGSFRLQLGNAAAAAAKLAAQSRAPATAAPVSVASATAPSGLTVAPSPTPSAPLATPATPPSTPVPPPFSSLSALSSPNVFATSPAANTPLRNSADRPHIGSNALRNSNGTNDPPSGASPAPGSVLSVALGAGSTSSGRTASPSGTTIGAARPSATKRVPGTAVAALPPPPSLSGSAPLPSPLSQPRSPRPTGMTTTPGPLPPPIPAPLAAPVAAPVVAPVVAPPPRTAESVLDAEEERIQRELEALEREERELSKGAAAGAEATQSLPEVLTSAWLGRELVPDRPLKLQRHPNARR